MQLCIFEDISVDFFEPLIFTRGVFDLLCGALSLKDKILRAYPGSSYSLICRQLIAPSVKDKYPDISVNDIPGDSCLLINGRVIAPRNLASLIPLADKSDRLYTKGDTVVAARLSGINLREFKLKASFPVDPSSFPNLHKEEVDVKIASYVWDLIRENNAELISDLAFPGPNNSNFLPYDGVHFINKDKIFIDENTIIKPGVVLDASNGPIFVGKNSTIFPNSVIIGPVYIGSGTLIKSLAKIYENVTIGDVCKVGGEVEDSIFLPYSNKQHDGFIGHAYLGSWVNIGADTNCSDLRNNYGFVKTYVNGQNINTNTQFLGLIIGDHSKTGINTMFNTGTTAGVSCNIFGSGFPAKYIPSFTWGGSDSFQTYDVDKCLDTAKVVMARRKIEFKKSDEDLLRSIFTLTKNERLNKGLTD
jgi:UDP-N-acetylglucosamine diphosphorylase/glucosamine-1-phosphate N-acetyltransferase